MKAQRGQWYSSTLSLALALDGVGGQHQVPAALPLKKMPDIRCREGLVGPIIALDCVKYIALTGIRSPDRPDLSKSLYRLSCCSALR